MSVHVMFFSFRYHFISLMKPFLDTYLKLTMTRRQGEMGIKDFANQYAKWSAYVQ
jgi:hypothetical protein